jgi:hypothetical protein
MASKILSVYSDQGDVPTAAMWLRRAAQPPVVKIAKASAWILAQFLTWLE